NEPKVCCRSTDSHHGHTGNKKGRLRGALLRGSCLPDQCAMSFQTLRLVKNIRPAKRTRKTRTTKPVDLRASRCGSAAHIRKAEMSREYWSSVSGEPSS